MKMKNEAPLDSHFLRNVSAKIIKIGSYVSKL